MDIPDFNIEQIKAIVLTGAIAGSVGGLFWKSISYFQSFFIWIYRRIIHTITIEANIYSNDGRAIDFWLFKNRQKNMRNIIVSNVLYYNTKFSDNRNLRNFHQKYFSGTQYIFYKNSLLILSKTRSRLNNATTTTNQNIYEEFFIVKSFFSKKRSYEWLSQICEEYEVNMRKENKMSIRYNGGKSLLLKENSFDDLVGDSPKHLKSLLTNNPYQNILLEGTPGNGKTRSIAASAFLLKNDLNVISLNNYTDTSLIDLYCNLSKDSILVIEEVDTFKSSLSRTSAIPNSLTNTEFISNNLTVTETYEDPRGGVTLGTLLNIFDGLITRDDITIILTTNHIEKLDPALIRPGRIHKIIHFGPPTEEDLKELFSRNNIEWKPEYLELKSFAEAQAKITEIVNPIIIL